MVVWNYEIYLQSQSHPLSMIINVFFFLIIPFAAPLSFNFNSFTPYDLNITYERANPANGFIQLTPNKCDSPMNVSIGRATYSKPMHLWDRASRNLADFTTNFSFVINSHHRESYGDGIAFFLAPAGSKIPDVEASGGNLGLRSDFSTEKSFVAVEFDIFQNSWDPEFNHVGIDINSMTSVNVVKWLSSTNILNGEINDVWIRYNSVSKTLSVFFTDTNRMGTTFKQSLHYFVDLRDCLPEWVTIGFSAATANASAMHSIYSWNFSSTLEIEENITTPTNPGVITPSSDPDPKSSKSQKGLVGGLAVVGGILVGVSSLVLFLFCKKKHGSQNKAGPGFVMSVVDNFERGTGPRKFSYKDLARATNNFMLEEKLGEGGFGEVYRGFLRDLNSYVAVKRVSRGSRQGLKEYASEVMIISRLRHRNLVQLIGWCHERRELLLVYEFMPNGSLDSHLFREKNFLTWIVRYKIAKGLASALLYLHEGWEQCVLHRDIKSSNIMLDSSFNAKLGDFGLARLVDHEKGSRTTILAGTIGYMAPDCVITGKASKESDVYSFGVVALEIACGRKPIDCSAQEECQITMIEWVRYLYGIGRLLEAADPKLSADFDKKEMECLMIVGLWCAQLDSNLRPSIKQAIHVLNFEAPLPNLPSEMPMPTYGTIPMFSAALSYGTIVSESSQMSYLAGR
ncbi:L-type lectin-domain containing receptor kinase IX.1-like [Cornus florida]|uniref:L-type lectin-domain containing receptor kinase IX.1-like n=1 Tax=Cornus florida TaxID=4283 RepID=UPI00289F1CFC|nr:L-type lectin-domain containing receptor kinase IX.1-like [Cornus florida]